MTEIRGRFFCFIAFRPFGLISTDYIGKRSISSSSFLVVGLPSPPKKPDPKVESGFFWGAAAPTCWWRGSRRWRSYPVAG